MRPVEFLVGPLPGTSVNLAGALVGPDVLRPFLENWEDVGRLVRHEETSMSHKWHIDGI